MACWFTYLSKVYNGVITTATIFNPFQNTGTGHRMFLQADADQGVRFLYGRIQKVSKEYGFPSTGQILKEEMKVVNLWIKRRKGSRPFVYYQNLQAIVNNPIAVYCIPYEQYSSQETDNIATVLWRSRIYYKDI